MVPELIAQFEALDDPCCDRKVEHKRPSAPSSPASSASPHERPHIGPSSTSTPQCNRSCWAMPPEVGPPVARTTSAAHHLSASVH